MLPLAEKIKKFDALLADKIGVIIKEVGLTNEEFSENLKYLVDEFRDQIRMAEEEAENESLEEEEDEEYLWLDDNDSLDGN